jgi:hypothetical protein
MLLKNLKANIRTLFGMQFRFHHDSATENFLLPIYSMFSKRKNVLHVVPSGGKECPTFSTGFFNETKFGEE